MPRPFFYAWANKGARLSSTTKQLCYNKIMSQHTLRTPKFNVIFGVDRPLSRVFASVFLNEPPDDAESDDAPGFNPFSWFAVSKVGIQTAIHAVEMYIRENGEPNFKAPDSVHVALEQDAQAHLANPGQSLNWTKNHGFVG